MEELKEVRIKRRRSRADVVKIGFSSTYKYVGTEDTNLRCHISIGNEIIEQLGWQTRYNIHLYESRGEKENNILILKALPINIISNPILPPNNSYVLQHVKNTFSHMISIPFLREVESKKIRTVKHEVVEMEKGKKVLKVFLDEAIDNDR